MEESQVPAEQTSTTASKEEKPNNIEALERKNRELLEEKKKLQEKSTEDVKKIIEQAEKERNEIKKTYAQKALKSGIRQKALELGATKADAVLRLMEKSDLEMIQVDEDFTVDSKGVLMAVERVQKEYPELFTKKSAQPKAIMPNGSGVQTEIKEDINNMSLDELKEHYKKQGVKK